MIPQVTHARESYNLNGCERGRPDVERGFLASFWDAPDGGPAWQGDRCDGESSIKIRIRTMADGKRFSGPGGAWRLGWPGPAVETAGYCRAALRDWGRAAGWRQSGKN